MSKDKEQLPALNDLFDINENMEGVDARLPQIGIAHQAQMFTMPDGSKAESFKGVILDHSRANAYWKESMDITGAGTPPDCFSMDGIKPGTCQEPQSDTCATCSQNQYGTAAKGGGKACKNMKRVHVMMSDQNKLMPFRLTVPPSNLGVVDKYITNLSVSGIAYQLVETEFSLTATKNKGGIEYSQLKLDVVKGSSVSDDAKGSAIKGLRDQWMTVMRGQELVSEEG